MRGKSKAGIVFFGKGTRFLREGCRKGLRESREGFKASRAKQRRVPDIGTGRKQKMRINRQGKGADDVQNDTIHPLKEDRGV